MPKLWVMSDLHLEAVRHPDAYRPRCAGFDVLVVAGDVRHGGAQAVATVARLAGGKPCVFVLGNHEAWHRELGAERAAALHRLTADGIPDALVTDLRLGPGMDGLALIAEARRRWPRLRAVLTSGADPARLDMHPADRFLGKPFGMGALIQVVTELAMDPAGAGCCTALQP